MSDYRDQFDCKLDLILQGKNPNAILPRKVKRDEWINRLLALENDGSKHSDDYNNLKRQYEVLKVGHENRLIRKRKHLKFSLVILSTICKFSTYGKIVAQNVNNLQKFADCKIFSTFGNDYADS